MGGKQLVLNVNKTKNMKYHTKEEETEAMAFNTWQCSNQGGYRS